MNNTYQLQCAIAASQSDAAVAAGEPYGSLFGQIPEQYPLEEGDEIPVSEFFWGREFAPNWYWVGVQHGSPEDHLAALAAQPLHG